jgi:hypothetical protein
MRSDRRALSETSISRLLVFAAPLLWALLLLFHPMPGGHSPYLGIKDDVDRWLLVHVGQLVLTPFLFLAVWRLLDGLPSAAARVSRSALVVWTVFFSAYDSIQGVATGVLVSHANGRAGDERAAVAGAIDSLVNDSILAGNISVLGLVAGAAWLVTAIAAAVALHRAGAGRAVVAATCLSIVFAMHVSPAAIGLLALAFAGIVRDRQGTRPTPGAPGGTAAAKPGIAAAV